VKTVPFNGPDMAMSLGFMPSLAGFRIQDLGKEFLSPSF
jgi:hypothetical protein